MIAEKEEIRVSERNERISPEELLRELRMSAVRYCKYDRLVAQEAQNISRYRRYGPSDVLSRLGTDLYKVFR